MSFTRFSAHVELSNTISLGIHGVLTLITTITPKPYINTYTHWHMYIYHAQFTCTHLCTYIPTQAALTNKHRDRWSPGENPMLVTSFNSHIIKTTMSGKISLLSEVSFTNTKKVPFPGCSVCSAGVLFSALWHLLTTTAHYQDCMTRATTHTCTCM